MRVRWTAAALSSLLVAGCAVGAFAAVGGPGGELRLPPGQELDGEAVGPLAVVEQHDRRPVRGPEGVQESAQGVDAPGLAVRLRAEVAETGLSFRQAHHVVGRLVGDCLGRGLRPDEVTPDLLEAAARAVLGRPVSLSAAALSAALDPWHAVEVRTLLGGPAPSTVRPLLSDAQSALSADRANLERLEQRLAAADEQLEHAVTALAGE